ncbi:hypothetical protein [Lacticaseibacillus paracasei]|uniref:hypothetical protein n=1 Tax=Lacticaseibacillus paracasei TaxID=1597 RepID=UPI00192B6FEC|nr:hypothetical protein [Lacticaseibacillus paracasei]CAD7484154.1 hypothetical protein LPIBR_50035 [Lacticaseibacillus paracasei]
MGEDVDKKYDQIISKVPRLPRLAKMQVYVYWQDYQLDKKIYDKAFKKTERE